MENYGTKNTCNFFYFILKCTFLIQTYIHYKRQSSILRNSELEAERLIKIKIKTFSWVNWESKKTAFNTTTEGK